MAIPKKILFPEKVSKVACGGSHTAFLTESNNLYLCGKGRDGQMGRGNQLESVAFYKAEPTKLDDIIDPVTGKSTDILDIVLGNNHCLAVVGTRQ